MSHYFFIQMEQEPGTFSVAVVGSDREELKQQVKGLRQLSEVNQLFCGEMAAWEKFSKKMLPDLIIVNGVSHTRLIDLIVEHDTRSQVLPVVENLNIQEFRELIYTGAAGYLLKRDSIDTLISAVLNIKNDRLGISPVISPTLVVVDKKSDINH